MTLVTPAIGSEFGLMVSQLLASAFAELHSGTAHGWDKTATKGGVALIVDRSKETKPKKIQIFDPKVGPIDACSDDSRSLTLSTYSIDI